MATKTTAAAKTPAKKATKPAAAKTATKKPKTVTLKDMKRAVTATQAKRLATVAAKAKPTKLELEVAEKAKKIPAAVAVVPPGATRAKLTEAQRQARYDMLLKNIEKLPNPIDRSKRLLALRTLEVIEGHSNFLCAYGPPGIGKTRDTLDMFAIYHAEEMARWAATPDELKVNDPWMMRRTSQDDKGKFQFEPPYSIVGGSIEWPKFYAAMWDTQMRGEILMIDDVISLGNKKIQSALQRATDPSTGGLVTYGIKGDVLNMNEDGYLKKRMQWDGSIILITNFRRDKTKRDEEAKRLFPAPLEDRVDAVVEFTWSRRWLWDFVNREAFEKFGLMGYLRGGSGREVPKDKRGLGFDGDDDKAKKLIMDVQEYVAKNLMFVPEISFRKMKNILKDRVNHPNHWRTLAKENHLSKVVIKTDE